MSFDLDLLQNRLSHNTIYLALSGYIDSQTAEHADEIHMKVIIGSEVLKKASHV